MVIKQKDSQADLAEYQSKLFFMFNSTEHEIWAWNFSSAHKNLNADK